MGGGGGDIDHYVNSGKIKTCYNLFNDLNFLYRSFWPLIYVKISFYIIQSLTFLIGFIESE